MKINEFLTKCFNFFVCVGIILAVGYYTGYLEGFTFADFRRAYYKISKDISSSEFIKNLKGDNSKNIRYKEFTVRRVPQEALDGAYYSHTWTQLFNGQKVIFYISDNNLEIHNTVQNFMSSPKNAQRYTVQVYSLGRFNNMRLGEVGPSKICDSLDECNAVRKKAVTYSYLTNFLTNCGKTVCIFKGNQYVQAKNAKQVKLMLNELKNW